MRRKRFVLAMVLVGCMMAGGIQSVIASENDLGTEDISEMVEIATESEMSVAIEEDVAEKENVLPDAESGAEAADEETAQIQEAETAYEGAENVEEEVEDAETEEDLEQASVPSVTYRTHVQTYGWQGWKKDGDMSGTEGRSKRLEGIEIRVQGDSNLGIRYRTHIQTYGWESSWKTDGQMSGTKGEAKRLEAIRIELTGNNASKYDVWYCVHAQKFGWLNWAKNGADAGTAGYAYRLEGIKIRILPKGSSAPKNEGTSQAAFYSKSEGPGMNAAASGVAYNTHVQTYGWQDYVYNGSMAGTKGQSKRLEGIHIALINPQYNGGIEYRTHIQTYGWETSWKSNGQMSGTSGQAKRLEAIQIRLTGEMANKYDVYYRVHAQKFGWMGWAKNGEQAGTAGYAYRLEGIQIVLVKKGGSVPGTNYGGQNRTTAAAFAQRTANNGTSPGSSTGIWDSFLKNARYKSDVKAGEYSPKNYMIKDAVGDSVPELFLSAPDGYGFGWGWVYMMINGQPKLIAHDYGRTAYSFSSKYRSIIYQGGRGNFFEQEFWSYDKNGNKNGSFSIIHDYPDTWYFKNGSGSRLISLEEAVKYTQSQDAQSWSKL